MTKTRRNTWRSSRVSAGFLAAVVGVAPTGCGDAGGPGSSRSGGDAWIVGEPTVTVAAGPGSDFYDVAGVTRLSDGRWVVADGGSSEVRYFAPDGTFLAAVGRRGEGPGEFALIQSLGPAGGDSVWVYDYGTARITILAPDGTTARTASVTPLLPSAVMVGRRSDGTFVLAQMWGSGEPGAPLAEGLVRERAVVARYGAGGDLLDTVARIPGREVLQHLEGARMVMGTAPFARTASHTLLGDDLVVGDQVDYVLDVLGAGGQVVRSLEWSGPPLDLTADDVARWREEQVARVPASERASVRASVAEIPVPEQRPAYGRLLADAAGYLWVAPYDSPSQDVVRWDVLDPSGHRLGPVDMPARFRPFQIGTDWVVGVAWDELDVERLEVRPLDRGAKAGP